MNTLKSNSLVQYLFICMGLAIFCTLCPSNGFAQKPSIGVLELETDGLIMQNKGLSDLARIELDKANTYTVLDIHEIYETLKKNDIDIRNCLSRTCQIEAGKALQANFMMSGSVKRFGEKIIVSLQLIKMDSGTIIKTSVKEFLNNQAEIQKIVGLAIADLLDLEVDEQINELLTYYNQPIENKQTRLKLNGPRMGIMYLSGESGEVLQNPIEKGGYDAYPVLSQMGYQWEIQYLSSGNFQALFELLPLVSGLDQGIFLPSFTFMNGFRLNKSGWEMAFGPSIHVISKAKGFYDSRGLLGETGEWHLQEDWENYASKNEPIDEFGATEENPYNLQSRLDIRGDLFLQSSWIWAIGKTFRSGYINVPVNVYFSPRKSGSVVGASIGVNLAKKK